MELREYIIIHTLLVKLMVKVRPKIWSGLVYKDGLGIIVLHLSVVTGYLFYDQTVLLYIHYRKRQFARGKKICRE
jgi:hypothetical protein